MRLSDAGLFRVKTKLIYPHHPPPPWPNEDAAPRSLEPIVRRRNYRVAILRMAINSTDVLRRRVDDDIDTSVFDHLQRYDRTGL
jgi:hypothetical protein